MAVCGERKENYDDGLSPQQRMEDIKAIFVAADDSGDQLIDLAEWLKADETQKGDKFDKAAATKEFKAIDQSNSGTISLAELDLYITNLQLTAVREKFKDADDDGNKRLDHKEFERFFKGEGMKGKAIKVLWKKCDKNGDGKVSYTEFSNWMEREMADGVLAETFGEMLALSKTDEMKKKRAERKANMGKKPKASGVCGSRKNASPADDEKEEKKESGDKQENYNDGLTPAARMEALKDVFKEADKSGDKLIDLKEWCDAQEKLKGDAYDKDEAKKVFKVIDQSNSGTISLAEFDLYVINLQMDGVRTRFRAADTSKDKRLDKKEFGKFFRGEGMKNKAIAKLWNKCDKNGDGKVSYTEFSDWMEREMADGVLAKTFGYDK